MNKRVGFITIGQSPRSDLLPEIQHILGPNITSLETGVLDDLKNEEIKALAPAAENTLSSKDDFSEAPTILVSRLRNGDWVSMEEEKILSIIQQKIEILEAQGVDLITLLCTGEFPHTFAASVPLLYPQRLLYAIVPQLGSCIGVVSPESVQVARSEQRWLQAAEKVIVSSTNPYKGAPELDKAAEKFLQYGADLCVLDCMGYTAEMKHRLETLTGLPVILPRTLVARVICEMVT